MAPRADLLKRIFLLEDSKVFPLFFRVARCLFNQLAGGKSLLSIGFEMGILGVVIGRKNNPFFEFDTGNRRTVHFFR